jgi:lipopolysaccharide export system permease protein
VHILDRYVTTEFLRGVLLSLIAFILIYVIVDLFEDLDMFIDRQVSPPIVGLFYVYQIPNITVLMLPVALLLACFLSIGMMERHNELVVLKASGIGPLRFLLPLFITGLAICLVVITINELVVPLANRRKAELEHTEIEKRPPTDDLVRRDFDYFGTKGHTYHASIYDARVKTLKDVTITTYRDGRVSQRLDSSEAFWKEGHWLFRDGIHRTFRPDGREITVRFDTLSLHELEERPEDFVRPQRDPEEMNYRELREHILRIRRSGEDPSKELVDLYLKFAFPFANLIIVIFGAPLAANIRRSGVATGVGVSLLICFIYWGFIQTARALGHNGSLPPGLAAWLPNGLFGGSSLLLLWRTRR